MQLDVNLLGVMRHNQNNLDYVIQEAHLERELVGGEVEPQHPLEE